MRLAADRAALAGACADAAGAPADALGTGLVLVAEAYAFTEAAADRAVDSVASQLAAIVGRGIPVLAMAAAPTVAMAVAAAGVAALLLPRAAAAVGLEDELAALGAAGLEALNRLVSRPETVALIRRTVGLMDDAMLGAIGVPPPFVSMLGEDGLGLAGLPFAAAVVTGLGGGAAGMLRETPVRIAEAHVVAEAAAPDPPQGWAERFDRIPSAGPGTDGMQVVIERYEMPDGSARFEVYVTGTVTFDPVARDEPWDMTSNVRNAMGADAGSVRAVVEAMRAAGVDASTPVLLNGYSQGGGIVARVATLPEFDVVGVVSFGGNTGQTPIPQDVLTVIVEHEDDLVPALGGRQDNDAAILVERQAYGPETPPPPGVVVPAHRRPAYAATAALMDEAEDPRLAAAAEQLDGFADGAVSVTVTEYRVERVDLEQGRGTRAADGPGP